MRRTGKPTIALVLLWVWLAVLGFAAPIAAQTNFSTGAVPAAADAADSAPDYKVWEKFAAEVDDFIADPRTSDVRLETVRDEVATWRAKFLAAQGTNSARIGTLRTQIDALGPPPAEGATEADDIAVRRKALTEQLSVLQAPSISAVEAYSRADGLIREIDSLMRDRQADELLQLWPIPINPANWPAGVSALMKSMDDVEAEVRAALSNETRRAAFMDKLPPIIALLLFAAFTILRGRALIEGVTLRLQERSHSDAREISAFVASLGQIVVPSLGVFAFSTAIILSGMLGPLGEVVARTLIEFGLIVFTARWLGIRSFPRAASAPTFLHMSAEARMRARVLTQALGITLGVEAIREALLPDSQISEAAAAVLSFPTILVGAAFLFQLCRLLLREPTKGESETTISFAARIIGILARGGVILALVGPVLAAAGYVRAGQALVFPAVATLGLVGLLFILQNLVAAIYAVVIRNDERGRDALVPALIGFFLTFLSIPLFALIWGTRVADLTELFTKLREGFQIGQTRISPSDFVLLAVVFGFGYLVTRLMQGALKSSVLPKTTLDQGGQNAIVAGVGYIGIFLSGLIAINSAGLDLSGLAIVAGALSVGIGFGLQNIVSNFVAGIILLIERPISEGDWIEVNGVMGTVRGISVRSTRIQTFDRTDVIVPNSDLVSGMVTNWTRFNLAGRLIVKIGVAYGTDTRKVEKILQEIAEAQPLAVLNPPPSVVLVNFGPDSLDFEIRVILRDVNFSLGVRSEINHEIARRFVEEGIEIPFGQRDIWLRNPEALAQMLASSPLAPGGAVALAEPEDDTPKPKAPRKRST